MMYQRSMVCISAERHASEGHIAAYEKDTGSFCMVPYVPPCAKGEPHRFEPPPIGLEERHFKMGIVKVGIYILKELRCADCGIAASEVKP